MAADFGFAGPCRACQGHWRINGVLRGLNRHMQGLDGQQRPVVAPASASASQAGRAAGGPGRVVLGVCSDSTRRALAMPQLNQQHKQRHTGFAGCGTGFAPAAAPTAHGTRAGRGHDAHQTSLSQPVCLVAGSLLGEVRELGFQPRWALAVVGPRLPAPCCSLPAPWLPPSRSGRIGPPEPGVRRRHGPWWLASAPLISLSHFLSILEVPTSSSASPWSFRRSLHSLL